MVGKGAGGLGFVVETERQAEESFGAAGGVGRVVRRRAGGGGAGLSSGLRREEVRVGLMVQGALGGICGISRGCPSPSRVAR